MRIGGDTGKLRLVVFLVSSLSMFFSNVPMVNAVSIIHEWTSFDYGSTSVVVESNKAILKNFEFSLSEAVNLDNNITFVIGNSTHFVGSATVNNWTSAYNPYKIVNTTPINLDGILYRTPYNLTLNFTGYNTSEVLQEIEFIESPEFINKTFLLCSPVCHQFRDNSVNLTLDIAFNQSMQSGITMASYSSPPSGTVAQNSGFGKFYTIDISPNATSFLRWVYYRQYYTDQNLTYYNVTNESALAFYIWNATTDKYEKVFGSGVNETGNYVYMNTTHFSTYGIFQEEFSSSSTTQSTPTTTTSSSGGGGGGGGGGDGRVPTSPNIGKKEPPRPPAIVCKPNDVIVEDRHVVKCLSDGSGLITLISCPVGTFPDINDTPSCKEIEVEVEEPVKEIKFEPEIFSIDWFKSVICTYLGLWC